MTNHKPTCPYCGAKMIPQRESTDMTRGIDFMQCGKCAARSPEIRTLNGAWDGKQDAALAVAMQRYVEPEEIAALRAENAAFKADIEARGQAAASDLRKYLPPKQDMMDLIGAADGTPFGCGRYPVWVDPEPYAMEAGAKVIDDLLVEVRRLRDENEALRNGGHFTALEGETP